MIVRRARILITGILAVLVCSGCATSGDSTSSKSANGAISGRWRTPNGATIAFNDLHRVLGNDGCNSFQGTWKTHAQNVALDVVSTARQCLAAPTLTLAKSMVWKVSGDTLTLRVPADHITNHLVRASATN